MQSANRNLTSELQRQQSIAVSPVAAESTLQLLKNEKQSLEKLELELENSKDQIRELSQSWRAGTSRLETLEKVSALMHDFNLSIVSQGREDETIVSQYIQDLFQLIDKQEPNDPIVFWQVEVTGAYFSIVDFLTAVDEKTKHIVPIGISMDADATDAAKKKWTIVFAI